MKIRVIKNVLVSLAAGIGVYFFIQQLHILFISLHNFIDLKKASSFFLIWKETNKEYSDPIIIYIVSIICFLLFLFLFRKNKVFGGEIEN